jgi:hypothetical protein
MVKWYWKFSRTRKIGIAVLGLFWLVAPLAGAATEGAELELPPKRVTLDQLLTLPSALPVESGQHGGLTRGEWSSRFAAAEADVVTAKADLDETLAELAEVVGKSSNWKVAAPGMQAGPSENSPANYGLKQEVRRRREDVERSERALRDLIVEANLAGVPQDWHRKPRSPE